MADLRYTSTGPMGFGGPAGPPMPPRALRCWQVMTGLAIDNRADAIDYLHQAESAVRLSTEALAALLEAFPLLPIPTHHIGRRTNNDAR